MIEKLFNPKSKQIMDFSLLSKFEVYQRFQKSFNCEQAVATKLTKMTNGYPYAVEILGSIMVNKTNGKIPKIKDVEKVRNEYKNTLFDQAYSKFFPKYSTMDQQYLFAVCGNHKLDEIAKIMGKSNVFVAQYRRRAIERNLVVPAKMGYVTFTLPFFEDYLQATKDVNSIFYLGL